MASKGKTKLSENSLEHYAPGQWPNSMKILGNNYWLAFQMTLVNKQIRFLNMFANSMFNYFNSTNRLFNKWMEFPTTNLMQENLNNIAKAMNLPTNSTMFPVMGKALFESTPDMDPMQTILEITQSPLTTATKPKRKKKDKKIIF